MINQQILSQITNPPLHQQLYEESLQAARQKYLISSKIRTLKEIQNIAKKLNEKQRSKPQPLPQNKGGRKSKMEMWAFGELKIFETVCILYSLLHSIQLQLFAQTQYAYLKNIFLLKTENFLKYQVATLQKSKVKSNAEWRKNQIQLFLAIVEQNQCFLQERLKSLQNLEWKYYSFQLFTLSKGRYYRTLKQCREKWNNYLNPQLSHSPWSVYEDIRLFELIREMGYKWAAISKKFGQQRTEHMVKNRFNSMIKSWKNKQLKSSLPEQISQKVLDFLNQIENKGQNSEKEEIQQIIDQELKYSESFMNMDKEAHKISISETSNPAIQLDSSLEEIDQSLKQQSELKSSNEAEEGQSDQPIAQYKESVYEWNRHIQYQHVRYEKEGEKEYKKTWDNQLESPDNTHVTKYDFLPEFSSNIRTYEFQPLFSQKYSHSTLPKKEFFNNELIEYLGCDNLQKITKEDSWLQQLQQKNMLSWLD